MSGTQSVSKQMSTSELIRYISRRCDRRGDLLEDLMDYYGVSCLAVLTVEQLIHYIDARLGGLEDVSDNARSY